MRAVCIERCMHGSEGGVVQSRPDSMLLPYFMLIMEGLNIKKISERLGMSISGVKRHREKMLLQNGCTDMLELIAKYHGMQGGEEG